jgi:hypothetical protein
LFFSIVRCTDFNVSGTEIYEQRREAQGATMTKSTIPRPLLRKAAAVVLETKLGYRVELDVGGRGVAPGARLLATKGSKTEYVAVRSAASRRIRAVRRDDGHWRTFPDVDLVVVAVPARSKANAIEVLGFKSGKIIECFDAAVKELPGATPYDEPVIVALDEKVRSGARTVPAGLKASAEWHHIVAIDDPFLKEVTNAESSAGGFVERVKREFAELNGVDVSKVAVEFKILS